MRNRTVTSVVLLGFLLCWGMQAGWTQEEKSKTAVSLSPVNAYHLDFSVNEMEDGKKINARQYSMNLNNSDANMIKIGTRVPLEVKQGEFQYLDVGTNIWSRLNERENGLAVEVRADITNFAVGERDNPGSRPLLRQMQINGSTIAQLGKALIIGSVDDPNSKRQFQLEVTVTKLH